MQPSSNTPDILFQLDLSNELSQKLAAIEAKKLASEKLVETETTAPIEATDFTRSQQISTKELCDKFHRLIFISHNQKLSAEEKLAIEQYKLAIITAVHSKLEQKLNENQQPAAEQQLKTPSFWDKSKVPLIAVLDVAPMSLLSFSGMTDLLSTIFGMAVSPPIIILSAVCTLIESVVYYFIMTHLLKASFKIQDKGKINPLLSTYEENLRLSEQISEKLLDVGRNSLSLQELNAYSQLSNLFSINLLNTELADFKPTLTMKIVHNILTAINLFTSVAGTFIGVKAAIIGMASAAFASTPIGWVIIAATVISLLLGRFVIRNQMIFNGLNPTAERHGRLSQRLAKFKQSKAAPQVNNLADLVFLKNDNANLQQANTEQANKGNHKTVLRLLSSSSQVSRKQEKPGDTRRMSRSLARDPATARSRSAPT